MKRRSFLFSSGMLLGASVLGADDSNTHHSHAHAQHTGPVMAECANRFLAALDDNQRGKASLPFDADERMNWHYVPNGFQSAVDTLGERKGLPLREMMAYQKHLASERSWISMVSTCCEEERRALMLDLP